MRFKTRGTFETEAIIDITQRVMAQLQEAGVDHVSRFNIYLYATDAEGRQRRFVKDGLEIEEVEVETWDLAVAEPEESAMTTVYANEPTRQRKPSYGRGRSSTPNYKRRTS